MKSLALAFALLTLSAASFARDVICVTDDSTVTFAMTMNKALTKALTLETEAGVILAAPQLKTEATGEAVVISANLGRSGSVMIDLQKLEESDVGTSFVGVANINVFLRLTTLGEKPVSCFAPKL